MDSRLTAGLLAVLLLTAVAHPSVAPSAGAAGAAFLSHDPVARTWTIGSGGATVTLALDPATDFQVMGITSASGTSWTAAPASDSIVKVGGQSLPFGSRAAGFVYRTVTTAADDTIVQLDATFDLPKSNLRVTRHFAAASGSPTFEVWMTFTSLAGTVAVSDLDALRLTIPAGTVHWVNGLTSLDPNPQRESAFTRRQQTLMIGQALTLGAAGRSSEDTIPWLSIDGDGEQLYAGLMWSGAWTSTASRSAAGIDLKMRLAAMTTNVQGSIDGPHAFVGVASGPGANPAAAMRQFITQRLRHGRVLQPLVTYNTWFAHGVDIDEATMRREIDGAAVVGAELFVLDAGWYLGAGSGGPSDFSSGLGNWQVDPVKFPSGLRSLVDYAHGRGLKFGLWIEPESAALSTLGKPGLAQESWLAKQNGKYGSSVAGLLCLGLPAARQWLLDQVTRLIDQVQPDYLKWDNNMWVNCDRAGHVHNGSDGNFAHVSGLYQILDEIRTRYPALLIENVSGGGNRLDLGMLRYSDAGWMDDRSAPSVFVRHNLEGLSTVFPPSYLLSFAMDGPDEPLHDAPDLKLYFRSRMPGALGLCYRFGDLDDSDVATMRHQIAWYKYLRGTLIDGTQTLLTPQASRTNGPAWDVLQTSGADGSVIIWAFQFDQRAGEFLVVPTGLSPDVVYDVVSADRGRIGFASGAALMTRGVRLQAFVLSSAHVVILRAAR